jgi:formylglycine-generating enzyme
MTPSNGSNGARSLGSSSTVRFENLWYFRGLRALGEWDNPGFEQTAQHPVVCVSWDDAKAYAEWLATKTGKNYRLLSEAEWEYAGRGATTTAWYWGETFDPLGCNCANIADATNDSGLAGPAECDDAYAYTAAIKSKQPNKFGLYDMIGDAREWTEDCWNDSYLGAPENGEVRTKGDCRQRMTRGGSWMDPAQRSRAAARNSVFSDYSAAYIGFRLARTD